MKRRISSKGQITLPVEFRAQDGMKPGEQLKVERLDAGKYRLTRAMQPRNQGLVQQLLACPVKDWFRPFDRTETTDDIRPPEFG